VWQSKRLDDFTDELEVKNVEKREKAKANKKRKAQAEAGTELQAEEAENADE